MSKRQAQAEKDMDGGVTFGWFPGSWWAWRGVIQEASNILVFFQRLPASGGLWLGACYVPFWLLCWEEGGTMWRLDTPPTKEMCGQT